MKKTTAPDAPKKKNKGFAVMSPEQRSAIARLGGLAVSKGRKGKAHMSAIGTVGGTNGGSAE